MRIHKTLGEDPWGFARLWERICKDLRDFERAFVGIHEDLQDFGRGFARLWERIRGDS